MRRSCRSSRAIAIAVGLFIVPLNAGCNSMKHGWRNDLDDLGRFGTSCAQGSSNENSPTPLLRHAWSDPDPHGSTWRSIEWGLQTDLHPDG